jgi:hypothetical protein
MNALQQHLARRALAWLGVFGVLALMAGLVLALFAVGPVHALGLRGTQPLPPQAAARYRSELTRAAHSQWGLDAPVALLAAQVHQESGWNPQAVSRVGAAGLAQFMPATATWWCGRAGTAAADCTPTNPAWALRAMVGYDRYLWGQLASAGDAPARWWATLRSYNGGLGHWQTEARVALRTAGAPTQPSTQPAIDAACGLARRHRSHCPENLGYPHRIMVVLQPRYQTWGAMVAAPQSNAAGAH